MGKTIKLPFNENQVVHIGWTGQNEYEEVTFDISAWLKKFPTGVVRVFYKLNTDGNLYPIADITSNTYIWKPQAADFPKPGRYSAQAIMESGTTIGKSDIFYFDIKKSLDHLNRISDDPPSEYPPSYIQKIMQDMEALAQRAESAAEHIPYYEDDKLYVWDEDTQQFVEFSLDIDSAVEEKVNEYFETHEVLTKDELDGAIDDALDKAKASGEFDGQDGAPGPQGPQGEPGKDGKDGQDGAQGPQGIPGKDGVDGQDGAPGPAGQNGSDGYSPTVAIESISGGNRVTITDANGPHIFNVMDGEDGGAAEAVLYIAQSLTSAQKAQARENIGAGTYSKPSGGIPKTDLAQAVQTSLGKADTALQQHQSLSGYATETWVQNQGYGTYSKPGGGISTSDLNLVDLGTWLDDAGANIYTLSLSGTTVTLDKSWLIVYSSLIGSARQNLFILPIGGTTQNLVVLILSLQKADAQNSPPSPPPTTANSSAWSTAHGRHRLNRSRHSPSPTRAATTPPTRLRARCRKLARNSQESTR